MKNDMATILCVDDERNILAVLRRLLRKEHYRLLTAESAAEGLKILEDEHPWVIISDQRMPGMDGVTFLKKVRETHPDIIRITLTGYTDVETIKEAVNQGHIFKFLLKPWNDENLILDIRQAVNQYRLAAANRELNDKVMAQNEELMKLNERLENLVKERTEEIIVRNQALEFSQSILSDLPVPLIGVGADGMIAMTNFALTSMFKGAVCFELGRMIEEYFEPGMLSSIRKVISGDIPSFTERGVLGGVYFSVDCAPLSGRYGGRGVVLVFRETWTSLPY
jgi:response regulator RpfG family c-di-GMP phosphodiesterase